MSKQQQFVDREIPEFVRRALENDYTASVSYCFGETEGTIIADPVLSITQ